ncbi:isopentenyl-diphosphate Delta-isomerase [[Candida] jaroonii]|uniref:Isopentenyl-diphosphate Delta-isomerase n=1 Tax=[Candida] jaroonii TaxID=467808 RepID=A0ACA9YCB0_9ASCO|nr:isopentenyl-diphosphate Delta-isomerase [[Candida] jaroonii]
MSYEQLVKDLKEQEILSKWNDVIPLSKISGVSTTSSSSQSNGDDVFEGHDEEQIRLMDELCIVLDYDDKPIGAGTKKLCHLMDNINQGLLHRAFSVFLFNDEGKLLLQQRADEKITFPSMWTNTCCSHPLSVKSELGPNDVFKLENAIEGAKVAAQRKLEHELGIPTDQVIIEDFNFLTRIHYKSASGDEASKWGEHEIDYILILKASNVDINANLNEVKDYKYVTQDELKEMFTKEDLVFTPWFKLICQTFLYKWWDNLDSLKQFEDETIHRLL